MFRPSRRRLLQALAAATTVAPLGRRARAGGVRGADMKFIFVYNLGGWDPTRVLAPAFGNPNVDMESDAEPMTVGDLSFVDHPDRPNVRAFFETWQDRLSIVNGVRGRSLAHDVCRQVSMTGTTSGTQPDWPSLLAQARANDCLLPDLVLSGPSYPAELSPYVARAGYQGQLQALSTGSILGSTDLPVSDASLADPDLIDAEVARRARAAAARARAGREADLTRTMSEAIDRATTLKAMRDELDFSTGLTVTDAMNLAVDALSMGLSRVVTLDFPNNVFPYSIHTWDSHVSNDANQSPLWDGLFENLSQLMDTLRATSGLVGASLLDETVVVVLSEMGRTPRLNTSGGKDHWPHNSAMLLIPDVAGRVIGGYDDDFLGMGVDLETGAVDEGADPIVDASLGATLLALGDIDPAEHADAPPITALLR